MTEWLEFARTSILTPVLVALITTLVVEYTAKPALEARKARIIRDRQQIDEVIFAFQRVSLLGSSFPQQSLIAIHPELSSMRTVAISGVDQAILALQDAFSRLSVNYVDKHSAHIRRTAWFLGHLKATTKHALDDPVRGGDKLYREIADLELFDVYFRVHVGLRDSQEPLVKRLFWRSATARSYEAAAAGKAASMGFVDEGSTDG
jgi:hypothetical protein